VVLSKDDVPVVLHDIHLDTVTDVARQFPDRKRDDGRYYALDFTVAELKQLHVSERFDVKTGRAVFPRRFPSWQSTFRIPTLEEELQLIQGLNRSTGRSVGIYPEIKRPQWHREQGRDVSRVVLPILEHYGYSTKSDACWLQCFELDEVRRLRSELGWQGRLVMLIGGEPKGEDGTDYTYLCSPRGLNELSAIVDGIGPAISRIVTWSPETPLQPTVTDLVKNAHAEKLVVHPYTVRVDDLPKNCPSVVALHQALFGTAGVDGVFTDFTDVTLSWINHYTATERPSR
jgi:glycerophosphoryl diester phosphodiesterase